MTRLLQGGEERLRAWLQASLANRIGFSLVSITAMFILLLGLASFLTVAKLTRDKQAEGLNEAATLGAERLVFTLNAIADDVKTLAENPQVVSGVLDSPDQAVYLKPLFSRFRPQGRTARSLCLVNYRGSMVECNDVMHHNHGDDPWLKALMGDARPGAMILRPDGRPTLRLAYPVLYEASGNAEGALVAEYDLGEIMRTTTGFLSDRFHLALSGAGNADWLGTRAIPGTLFQSQGLDLAPMLAPLGLTLHVGIPAASLWQDLGLLIATYLALGALLIFLAWKISSRTANALAFRLESVTAQAERVAQTGLLKYGLIIEGRDEIARLSRAFAAMTERVREINESLEQRVAERTEELARANLRLERHQEELEQTVRARTEELAALNAHIDNVREEEKAAIARELHDEFGGILTAIKMGLAKLADPDLAASPEHLARIRELLRQADQAIIVMRRILDTLRPSLLDHLGIGAAIHWQAQEFTRRTGIPCEVVLYDDDARLDNAASITLFRVMQEALTNVMRHAGASRVTVSLSRNGNEITLEILDNGMGIQKGPGSSHGIRGMEERARRLDGKLAIASEAGKGTRVELNLPV